MSLCWRDVSVSVSPNYSPAGGGTAEHDLGLRDVSLGP